MDNTVLKKIMEIMAPWSAIVGITTAAPVLFKWGVQVGHESGFSGPDLANHNYLPEIVLVIWCEKSYKKLNTKLRGSYGE